MDATEADKMLSYPLDAKYEVPFEAYTGFAKNFGIGELQVGSSTSFLIGHRDLEGISFCSLNSAWFCRDNTDKEQLWIGRPIFDVLETPGRCCIPRNSQPLLPPYSFSIIPKIGITIRKFTLEVAPIRSMWSQAVVT